jgi:hypothetical protein
MGWVITIVLPDQPAGADKLSVRRIPSFADFAEQAAQGRRKFESYDTE